MGTMAVLIDMDDYVVNSNKIQIADAKIPWPPPVPSTFQ